MAERKFQRRRRTRRGEESEATKSTVVVEEATTTEEVKDRPELPAPDVVADDEVEQLQSDEVKKPDHPRPQNIRHALSERDREKRSSRVRQVDPDVISAENPFEKLVAALPLGHSLVVTHVASARYDVCTLETFNVRRKKRGTGRLPRGFNDSMLSDEFRAWREEWNKYSYAEKVKYAEGNGVEWERYQIQRIDHMRLSEAVRVFEKVEKYKPDFVSRAARSRARNDARISTL